MSRIDRLHKVFHLVLRQDADVGLITVGPNNLAAGIPINSGETVSDLLTQLCVDDSRITFDGEMVLTETNTFRPPAVIFSIAVLDEAILDGHNTFVVEQILNG